jgi:hypothetical protein
MSVYTIHTRRHIPEDGIFKSKERSLVAVPVGPIDLHVRTLEKRSKYYFIIIQVVKV